MPTTNPYGLAVWSAYLSAVATIAGAVTLILFFSVGAPFGVINDAISVVGSLVIIPILFALHQLHHSHAPAASLGVLVVGIIVMLVAATLQTLLVFDVITYGQTAVIVPSAYGVVGLSLITYNYLAYVNGSFPRKLAVCGIVAGGGYVTACLGFVLGGANHPLTYVGGLVSIIAYPTWAIWFGRVLLKSN